MFEYKKISDKYWITSNKTKWEFWPFDWIFVKNKYLWDIDKTKIDEKEFTWYKYSIWVYKNSIFVVWLGGIERIVKI